ATPSGTYAYDATGNQTRAPARRIEWNAAGQPTAVHVAAGVVRYQYGPLGQRVARQGITGRWTRFIRDVEVTASGTRRTVYRVGRTAIGQRDAAGMRYYHTDQVGTPVAITGAAGKLNRRLNVDPYGAPASATAAVG